MSTYLIIFLTATCIAGVVRIGLRDTEIEGSN